MMKAAHAFSIRSTTITLLLLAAGYPVCADQILPPPGIDIVNHDLRVIMDIGDDGAIDETLVFSGVMTIERGAPFTNSQGFQQVNFVVLEWTAITFSQILGMEIEYRKSDVEQPISTIISEQLDTVYPVYFKFNVIFDVFAGGNLVFSRHHGMPEGGGFMSVPPDGNSPRITQFEDAQIVVSHPQLGPIRFTPLDCQDTSSVTIPEPSGTILVSTGIMLLMAHSVTTLTKCKKTHN